MKKLFLFLLVFLLIGCTTKEETLEGVVNKITISSSLSSDLELPSSYLVNGKDAQATWVSSNPSVLSNEGIVTKGANNVELTLSLALKLEGKEAKRDFLITVLGASNLSELINTITIPATISENITLPIIYQFLGEDVSAIWESSNVNVLSNSGEVFADLESYDLTLRLTLFSDTDYASKDFTVSVSSLTPEDFLDNLLSKVSVGEETKTTINLARFVFNKNKAYAITWTSSQEDALSSDGRVGFISQDSLVTLTASISVNNTTRTKEFTVKAIARSEDEKADYIFNFLQIPSRTAANLQLPTDFPFGLEGTWTSSNLDALSNEGIISPSLSKHTTVTLRLLLSNQKERTFEVVISINSHLILDRTFSGTKDNVSIVNGKLELNATALEGTYTTNEIETLPFSSAVASWAAISAPNATVELFIRVRVGTTWSKYFSYGQWGLGNNNALFDQKDNVAKLSTDEVIIQSNTADALQIKIILKRTSASISSPVVTLVAAALQIPGYKYPVDITELPQQTDHNVPTLNQNIVPGIGSVICSPTSSTMLLKYKGHDFSSKGTYEHEYIAELFKDHGDFNAYGNWVYNTVGMSAFGETSYVKRFYSYEEMLVHLYEVGPMAASIRGSVIAEKGKNYTTNGHLIVVRGYRFDGNQLYIIVNDPNQVNVYDEMKIENFLNVWRNVNYVIE